jgi:hypothetical protein
MVSNNNF